MAKIRANMALGQGVVVPLPRPKRAWLEALAVDESADGALAAGAWSGSAMWAANAPAVSPAPDTADGRCHLTVANLAAMPHRSQQWRDTLRQLRLAVADSRHFAVHQPMPQCFGDEGAANHMRLAGAHGEQGVEISVHGPIGWPVPGAEA